MAVIISCTREKYRVQSKETLHSKENYTNHDPDRIKNYPNISYCYSSEEGAGNTGPFCFSTIFIEMNCAKERGRPGKNRNSRREFSVYVGNLPNGLDRFGLRGIFQKVGSVCDVYIPVRGLWGKQGRFGFVRYRNIKEAYACIRRFNGKLVRGNTIKVDLARPKKSQQRQGHEGSPRPSSQWQVKNVSISGEKPREVDSPQVEQSRLFNLSREKIDNTEWLIRTLVCTTAESRDLATLASAINGSIGQYIKVAALSCHKFLLTFPTLEEFRVSSN